MTSQELEQKIKDQQEIIDFLLDRVRVLALKAQISFDPPNEQKQKMILDTQI